MIGIYKITSPSGKVYIGESKNIESRWKSYRFYDCKSQAKLYNSFKKYGVENHKFEVLMECAFEDLKYFESCFQEIYRVVEKGLNCKYTSREDKKGTHSLETKLKISNNHQSKKEGYVHPRKGKKMSKEFSENCSIGQKKLYENGFVSPNIGRKRTEESRKKMSESQKKLYENGYVSPNSKQVINTQNGFIYDSAIEAYHISGYSCSESYFKSMLNKRVKNKTNYEYINNIK